MKTCEVGEMRLTFDHENKEVEIMLIDRVCRHTLTHHVSYDSWRDLQDES